MADRPSPVEDRGQFTTVYNDLDELSRADCSCKELMTVLLEVIQLLRSMDRRIERLEREKRA